MRLQMQVDDKQMLARIRKMRAHANDFAWRAAARMSNEFRKHLKSATRMYPARTGNLRGSLYRWRTIHPEGDGGRNFGIGAYLTGVRQRRSIAGPGAPHVHLLEDGWVMRYKRLRLASGRWVTVKSKPYSVPKSRRGDRIFAAAIKRAFPLAQQRGLEQLSREMDRI